MDLTQGTEKQKHERSRKMMLWFAMASLLMAFAGWTSAYIISSKREDWLHDLELPMAFFVSTVILLLSSLTYIAAKRAVKANKQKRGTTWLWVTLILGGLFVGLQFYGFSQMLANGYYFTGPTSNIKTSYIFLIAFVHFLHIAAGITSLVVVLARQVRGKYGPDKMLGIDLGASFWHFLDLLWLYLILFMSFVK